MSPGAERIMLPAGITAFALIAAAILVMLLRAAIKLNRIRKSLEERSRMLRRLCEQQPTSAGIDAHDGR